MIDSLNEWREAALHGSNALAMSGQIVSGRSIDAPMRRDTKTYKKLICARPIAKDWKLKRTKFRKTDPG